MTTETAQCFTEIHPDLLYIQITAWATVCMVIATIGMIVWQIKSQKNANKIELSMRLMDQYDSMQMRENRKSLALILQQGEAPGAIVMETVVDVLETLAVLHRRKLVDDDLIENGFSVPIRYWWCALKDDITKMRNEFHDVTIYEEFQLLASKYSAIELAHHRDPAISQPDLSKFLMSELA
jgi:hypothetical protein